MVTYWKIVWSFLIGAALLSALATLQKISMGVPLAIRGYAVPFIGGGIFGALIGIWRQRVKESEERFRASFENAPIGMALVGLDERILRVNGALCDILGYSEKELLSKTVSDITHPADRKAEADVKESIRGTGKKHYGMRKRYIRSDGRVVYGKLSVSLVTNDQGSPRYYIGQLEDITAQYAAEARLREAEERYRILFEQSPDAIVIVDPRTSLPLDFNQRAADLLGYSHDEFARLKVSDCEAPEWKGEMEGHTERILRDGGDSFETRMLRKDGSVIDVLVMAKGIEVSGRRAFHNIFHDITGRKKALVALQESESRFREMAENIKEVFWLFDWKRQRVIYVSPAYEDIWGRSVNDLYDRYEEWGESIHPDDVSHAQESFNRILRTGGGEPREYRIIRPDGTVRWVSDIGYAIRDRDGEVLRITGIAEDITERKLYEHQIESSLREKELLLKEIHHRVKNNMQIILSLLKMQSRSARNREVEGILREPQGRIQAMAIIHEMLYRSKDLSSIDMESYVKSLVSNLSNTYHATVSDVAMKIEVDRIPLGIDTAIPLGLLINELVSNALKHAFPEGRQGEIRIELHRDGNEFELVVSDNGTGLCEEVDIRNTESLGLQLVVTLAEQQLNGSLEVDCSKGTSFKARFSELDYESRINV